MTAYERQNAVIDLINGLGDCFNQYSYLMLIAGQHPSISEREKTQQHIVSGCQSLVWVIAENNNGILKVKADSDTLIIKGVLSLIVQIADNSPASEIADMEFDVLNKTDLGLVFESQRLNGIASVWQHIRRISREAQSV